MREHIEIIKAMMESLKFSTVDKKPILPTLKVAKIAIEKQMPKKFELWNGQCSCPNCNKLFGNYSQLKTLIHWEMPFCKFCGQALDWSNYNDRT